VRRLDAWIFCDEGAAMSYDYRTQRPRVFTEDGQVMFLKIRDKAKELTGLAGAVSSGKLLCVTGEVWDMLACIDRLVELGELIEINNPYSGAGQDRIFIAPWRGA
jgi:hypothetical protein